ncbi:MAG: twin-arginine translocase subunit TatB [Sideroxydans sp.]|nr:twin-arginine translocase subunit TatB [Sideroxydans sp.]
MFGVDFSELMVILVIALIVIGPERLPKVARTLGMLWGRAQRYINGVKADIARDMAIEEFRQLQQKVQQEAGAMTQAVKQTTQAVDQQVRELNHTVAQPAEEIAQQLKAPVQQAQLELQPPVADQKKFPVD